MMKTRPGLARSKDVMSMDAGYVNEIEKKQVDRKSCLQKSALRLYEIVSK